MLVSDVCYIDLWSIAVLLRLEQWQAFEGNSSGNVIWHDGREPFTRVRFQN